MSSSNTRRLSLGALLFWFLVLAGAWYGGQNALYQVDTRIYRELGHYVHGWPEGEYPQLLHPGQQPETEEVFTETRHWECPEVATVELHDEACAASFAALPLGPQDLAVMLERLRKGGTHTVGLSSALTWQQEPGAMAREMLCHVLAGFPCSAVGLRGRTAAQADFTPAMLRDAAIPQENIQGDTSGLPSSNRPLPNGLAETPDALNVVWAPDWLQEEPLTHNPSAVEDISFPLLVRWNGEIIPTLPLRLAMGHTGLKPQDIRAIPGKEIRLGERSLPMDEHGRIRLSEGSSCTLPLADVLTREKLPPVVMLEQPPPGQNSPRRLQRLARTFSQLAGTEKVERTGHKQICGGHALRQVEWMAGWKKQALAGGILLLALWILPFFPGWLRMLILIIVPAWLLWLANQALQMSYWFPVAHALAWWVLLLAAFLFLRPVEKGLFGRRR